MVDEALLSNLFDELFPICRSITGPGFRESLEILRRHMPLELESVASGTKVFDWKVPPEWIIREAVLTGPDGEVVVDFKDCNLHVVNYSESVDQALSLDDLQPHLHSIPRLPTAVPYVTSYYKRNWGFCLSHEQRASLKPGVYRAYIDAEHKEDGELNLAQCVLPGDSEREILLTSYLCHPSLANNELSGPLVLLGLYDRISRWKKRRYTYRFLINPETIGSLCFLHLYGDQLRERLDGGLVLTCLGGRNSRLSYQTSRRETALFDRLAKKLNSDGTTGFELRRFQPIGGSDERQFCSPGFDLPMGQFARDIYQQYDGYHNSLDDKEFMGIGQLMDAIDNIERFLHAGEIAGKFTNLQPFGEPQLGRRGLYPSMNSEQTRYAGTDDGSLTGEGLDRLRYILAYSDGHFDMMEISEKAGCPLVELQPIIERLEQAELLRL